MNNVTTLKTRRGRGQNATKFGIFSNRKMALRDESQKEIDAYISQLHDDFRPHGLLETELVRKIGWCLVKQQRLRKAEVSSIELQKGDRQVLEEVRQLLRDNTISQDDLDKEVDTGAISDCEAVLRNGDDIDVETISRCVQVGRLYERHAMIKTVAELVRDRRSVVEGQHIDRLSLYQSRLDSELYRTIRELRVQQEYRLRNLEPIEN